MWILDKIFPGSAKEQAAIGPETYDEFVARTGVDPEAVFRQAKLAEVGIISKEQARRELGIDDPYMDWATRSEHQWRERANRGKCLWCTTPYEDESGSCTKCGAPKEAVGVQPRFSNVTWRI